MVSYETRNAQVSTIFDDVRMETADYLGFMKEGEKQLFSKPVYLHRDEFSKRVKNLGLEVAEDVDVKGLIAFRDGNIYLSHDALDGDLFEQWLFAVLTYFQPYAYVMEETGYGKWVSKEAKSGKRLEGLGSNLLGGICRVVEIDAIKKYRNYYSREVEREIMKILEEIGEGEDEDQKREAQEGYRIVRGIQDRLKKCEDEMDDTTRARIVKAVLKAAGRDENFDPNLKEMVSWEIHEIYEAAGARILDPPRYVGEVEDLAEEVRNLTGSRRQGREVVPKIEELIKRYERDLGGDPERVKRLNETKNNLLNYSEYDPYKEIPDAYKTLVIQEMDDLSSDLQKIKKRKRKIDFE